MIEIIVAAAIAFGIGHYLGAKAGWHAREVHARRYVEEFHQHVQETIKDKHIPLNITQEGEVFYVYNSTTGAFMCQGKTYEELTELLNKKYPGKMFTASHEDMAKFGVTNDAV